MTAALQNIEKIKTLFLETQQSFAQHGLKALEGAAGEFSSIAYESASMCLALSAGAFPRDWLAFADGPAAAHRAQVYVGLGWAVARPAIPFAQAVQQTDARFAFRIADGCGYYDGTFRRRQTVLNKSLPAYLPAAALPMYDQGVGRSLWYSEQADVAKTLQALESFAAERRADLWRGVGIAVAYVGGYAETDLEALFGAAAEHGLQLARGAALAAKSRTTAHTMTDDTDRCSRHWFERAVKGERYADWLETNEQQLAASFTVG
jgi:hypothetical protein